MERRRAGDKARKARRKEPRKKDRSRPRRDETETEDPDGKKILVVVVRNKKELADELQEQHSDVEQRKVDSEKVIINHKSNIKVAKSQFFSFLGYNNHKLLLRMNHLLVPGLSQARFTVSISPGQSVLLANSDQFVKTKLSLKT